MCLQKVKIRLNDVVVWSLHLNYPAYKEEVHNQFKKMQNILYETIA